MESRNGLLIAAIVGCGEVGDQKHLRALTDVAEVQVIAVVDCDAGRLAAASARHCIAARYGSVPELLERPGIEAVGVCVPPAQHAAVVEAVLAAGKHVLVEKPLALSAADASRMIDAANRAPNKVLVGFHMRWHRLIRQTREVVRSGRLGTIESIRVTWFSPREDEGLPEWRWRRESGGGALVEIGVHCYDLWRFLLDVEVEEVYAVSRSANRDDESAVVTAR